MFKFIHAADPHLDSPLRGLETHEDAPVDLLRGATRRAFENLIDLAIAEEIHFLLIAGDLYDGDWKDYSTGLFFRAQMVRLKDKGIPVYLIAGNHDAESVISKKLSLPENVHVFSTRSAESIEVPGIPAVVHGRGFPNRAVPENLAKDYPAAVNGKFNVGLLHTSLTGLPGHDTYAPCTEQDLRDKGYHYWALGHIHKPEILGENPWIVFAGNCQGRHVRETGKRGCRLVCVSDSHEVSDVAWRSLDVVRWEMLEIDLSGIDSEAAAMGKIREAIDDTMEASEERLVAARIVLHGATALHGRLHLDVHRFRAEVLALSQDYGNETLWIEQVKIKTTPVYDLEELKERDVLTKSVLDALDQVTGEATALPKEVDEMLGVLPPEIRAEVEGEWKSEARAEILEDVRAMVLQALQVKGGDEQ